MSSKPGSKKPRPPAPSRDPVSYRRVVAIVLPLAAIWWAAFAWGTRGVFWPDEVHQSLEQAHRLVFGYGFVPWEYQLGARSWILPGLLADGWQDSPVDAIDLHVYHPDGGLPSREDLPVHIGDLPLWAG